MVLVQRMAKRNENQLARRGRLSYIIAGKTPAFMTSCADVIASVTQRVRQ
jgi:hypothetical protein